MENRFISSTGVMAAGYSQNIPPEELESRNYKLLWWGQQVSQIGDTIFFTLISLWIYSTTMSTLMLGIVMAIPGLTWLIVSRLAGNFVDGCCKKTWVVGLDIFRGLLMIVLSIVVWAGLMEFWTAISASFVLAVCSAIFSPLLYAFLSVIVEPKRQQKAIAYFIIGSSLASLAGYFLLALSRHYSVGVAVIIAINGLSFIISGIYEYKIDVSENRRESKSIKKVIKEKTSDKGYVLVMIIVCSYLSVNGMAFMLLIPHLKNIFQFGGEIFYCLAMSSFAAGMCLGPYLVALKPIKKMSDYIIFFICLVVNIVCMIVSAYVVELLIILLMMFFIGAAGNTITYLITQIITARSINYCGRAIGNRNSITVGLVSLTVLLGGLLAESVSIPKIIIVGHSFVLLMLIGFSFAKSFRSFFKLAELVEQ